MLAFGNLVGRFTTITLAAALALIICEFSVRFTVPKYDPAGHVAFYTDPSLGVALGKPNSTSRQIKNSGDYDVEVVFNRHGLRDRRDVSTGTRKDLYVVGDSFAYGWGVEEDKRFSDILENKIDRKVFNLATTSNVDGYEILLSYAEKLGADIQDVVVAINMIDDVKDYKLIAEPALLAAEPAPARFSVQPIKQYLLTHSALYFLSSSAIGSIDVLRRFLVRLGLVKTIDIVSGGIPDFRGIRSTVDQIEVWSKKYNLTILIIPSRSLWAGTRRAESAAAHTNFVSELVRRNLNFVDMRPVMEQTGNPMQFHFRNDGHWVPKGHLLAAQLLARRITPAVPGAAHN
jgi:hypothetical protein